MLALSQHMAHLKKLCDKFGQELPGLVILKKLYNMMLKLKHKLEGSHEHAEIYLSSIESV